MFISWMTQLIGFKSLIKFKLARRQCSFPSMELNQEISVQTCLQAYISIPQTLSFNQQTVQNMDNVHAFLEDDEDCKNKEPFQGK